LCRDLLGDPQHPGVCPGIDARGEVRCDAKSHLWFASYHTARTLLLSADRLQRLGQEDGLSARARSPR
jgi:hypothetical protein